MTRRVLIGAAVLLLVVVAGYAVAGLAASDSGIPTYEVERGRFVHRVDADGMLAAEQATVLAAPQGARQPLKLAWIAQDGTAVEEGEVVIRFDPTDMENELFTGEADRAKAESQAHQTDLQQGAVLENLERDARMAARQLQHAEEFQTDDESIFSRMEIIESSIDGDLAEERKEHAEQLRELREAQGGVELDLIELQRRQAQLTIDRANAGLQELEVRAPHEGIFVLRQDRGEPPTVGQLVWPGQDLGELPALGRMRAQVYVLEADAGGLEEGMRARVRLEAHPGEIVEASVRRVASVTQRRARWSPVQYFEVDLELERTDPDKMKPGQRVRATILIQDLEDVVAVPRDAVFREDDGDAYVWVRSAGDWERTSVRLGPAALGRIVIEDGLEDGDVIALQDPEHSATVEPTAPAPSGPGIQPTGGRP